MTVQSNKSRPAFTAIRYQQGEERQHDQQIMELLGNKKAI